MAGFLKRFFSKERDLYVTEFGHSVLDSSKTVGPRTREQYLLHFVAKGYSEFSGFKVEAGEAFLISKEICHSFTTSEEYEQYWIGFDGSAVEELFALYNLKTKPHQLFSVENAEFAESLFSSAKGVLKFKDAESSESVALAVLSAFLPLLRSEARSDSYKRSDYLEKAMRYIQINYVHPISLEKIAREIHITEKYMYRLFIEKLGISAQQYVVNIRMKKAMELLSSTDLSIKEVAASVGYSSTPSFSKTFSLHFGTPPSSVRRKGQ